MEAVALAGRESELGYQLSRLAKSLKRDVEFTISQNQVLDAGTAEGAGDDFRQLGSYECWITGARADRGPSSGTAGADATFSAGTPTTAPVDCDTQRALQEYMLQGVLQACWTSGGEVNLIVTGPFNKRVISGFAGNSTRMDIGEDQRLTAAISVYISDYGEHRIVASRFSRDRTVLCIDTQYWSVNYLRPFREKALAVVGDSEQRMMNAEYTLCAYNAASSGAIADLTTTV